MVFLEEKFMKSLKDCKALINDSENEIALYIIKNLRQDLEVVFKRYASLNSNSLAVKIKVLKDNRYVIDVECITDFLLVSDNI